MKHYALILATLLSLLLPVQSRGGDVIGGYGDFIFGKNTKRQAKINLNKICAYVDEDNIIGPILNGEECKIRMAPFDNLKIDITLFFSDAWFEKNQTLYSIQFTMDYSPQLLQRVKRYIEDKWSIFEPWNCPKPTEPDRGYGSNYSRECGGTFNQDRIHLVHRKRDIKNANGSFTWEEIELEYWQRPLPLILFNYGY